MIRRSQATFLRHRVVTEWLRPVQCCWVVAASVGRWTEMMRSGLLLMLAAGMLTVMGQWVDDDYDGRVWEDVNCETVMNSQHESLDVTQLNTQHQLHFYLDVQVSLLQSSSSSSSYGQYLYHWRYIQTSYESSRFQSNIWLYPWSIQEDQIKPILTTRLIAKV